MLLEEARLAKDEAQHKMELCALTGRELERAEREVEFLKSKVERLEGKEDGEVKQGIDDAEDDGAGGGGWEEVQHLRERVTWLEAELLRQGGAQEEEIDLETVMQFLEDTQEVSGEAELSFSGGSTENHLCLAVSLSPWAAVLLGLLHSRLSPLPVCLLFALPLLSPPLYYTAVALEFCGCMRWLHMLACGDLFSNVYAHM